ncbi:Sec-independent protein translocase protein TatB [Aromatoleum aromaticum]|uniref:Sec-independent protein translocase protein TatB n=1 Tax=Aromatoleum aromaticum (strain DSM 19018 / LMG 30748 / EbN1) TaxID=76114 RepID=TATB_AROAE|nr:Sec-independent protein translocase protein TatB [Aromatoleum aromaticum]Q5P7A0.1 RecName: Full=Sec-independent protein translocase protein TatB [Aromatoleum aromaticum EbN1]NMG53653.1 twin-arginine translocase subunit TatB [Aromatoleum aromaticum]CAI06811.1 Sec-independent protein translocase subunit B [Aromatoleum aromaticum EbN1]
MFDFGFSELIVIAVVTLIVVGPERLPKVARTAGHLLGRLQRYVSDVKSDIKREMQLEELKALQQQVEQQARELESSMRGEAAKIEADVNKTVAEVKSGVTVDAAPVPLTHAVEAPAAPAPMSLAPHGDAASAGREPAAVPGSGPEKA